MTVTFLAGFEGNDGGSVVNIDSIFHSGTAAYSTVQQRTGTYALRCNPASGTQGYGGNLPSGSNYVHFGFYIATLPTADRIVYGDNGTGGINVKLTSAGNLALYLAGVLIATGSTVLSTSTWYWIGVRQVTGTSVAFLQINGVTEVTGTATVSLTDGAFGCFGTEASAIDIYFDDVVVDDTGFIAASKVALLLPISDNSVGSGWTVGGGGTTNLFAAVDSTPPIGVADGSATATSQIRNAGANTNAYAAT